MAGVSPPRTESIAPHENTLPVEQEPGRKNGIVPRQDTHEKEILVRS
jgi:hypothetical protein